MESNTDEYNRLLEEIERLRQEKIALNQRVRSVGVLAKVLQDSKDENSKLKQEVLHLRSEIEGSSLDVSPSFLSLKTTSSMKAGDRCFLSQTEDDPLSLAESFEYVNTNTNPSLSAGQSMTQMPHPEFHIKDLSSGFKTIKDHSEMLLQQAKEMLEQIANAENKSESADLTNKVSNLVKRIGKHAKDAKTRETLLQGLANEEEVLKDKVQAMEIEQATQEKMMEDLKLQLKDDQEELESIREQVELLCEAVFVNKEDVSFENFSSSETTSNRTSSQLSSLSKVAEKDREFGEIPTPQSCGRCCELSQALNQAKKDKEEAIRQKEEILDVNHAWDASYKKLKTETGKEIADLKQQIEVLKTTDPWMSAKSMIDTERQVKEKALEDKQKIEDKCKLLEEKLQRLPFQTKAQQQHDRLLFQKPGSASTTSFQFPINQNQLSPVSQSSSSGPAADQDVIKEIEVLKQQLRVYVDDFTIERRDRERMQSEKENLETELREVKEQISVLKEQLRFYEEDFGKERQENERLRRQLNSREGGGPDSNLNEMTRKAQAVAERQARLRALREQYDREERHLLQDQQDLQQRARVLAIHPASQPPGYRNDLYSVNRSWPSPEIHPRGPTEPHRPSSDMFHGGEVQADNRNIGFEVVDGSNDESFCPRCYRAFPPEDKESFRKHKLKCCE